MHEDYISIKVALNEFISEVEKPNDSLWTAVHDRKVKCTFHVCQYAFLISGFSEGLLDAEVEITSLKKINDYVTPYDLDSMSDLIRGEAKTCEIPIVIHGNEVRILVSNDAYKLQEDNPDTLFGYCIASYIQPKELTTFNLGVNKSDLIKHFRLTEPSKFKKPNTGTSPEYREARTRARELAKAFWKEEQENGNKTVTRLIHMARIIKLYFKEKEPQHHGKCKTEESMKAWLEDIAPTYAEKKGRPPKTEYHLTYEMIKTNTDK